MYKIYLISICKIKLMSKQTRNPVTQVNHQLSQYLFAVEQIEVSEHFVDNKFNSFYDAVEVGAS